MASSQLEPIPEDPADFPTDLPSMIKWRGRSKARHTAALNKAVAAINGQGDRDHLRALRHNIVTAYEEVEERHNWLIQKRPALPEGEIDKEVTWLANITDDHRKVITAIDIYIAPLASSAPSESHRSRSSTKSSASAAKLRLLETERREKEAALRLQQINEETEIRQQEDDMLDQQRKMERQVEAERKKRSAQADWERSQLNASVVRQQIEDDANFTPVPDIDQLNQLTTAQQFATPMSAYAQQYSLEPTIMADELNSTVQQSSAKPPGPFSQFLSRAIGVFTPRRTNPAPLQRWSSIPTFFQRQQGSNPSIGPQHVAPPNPPLISTANASGMVQANASANVPMAPPIIPQGGPSRFVPPVSSRASAPTPPWTQFGQTPHGIPRAGTNTVPPNRFAPPFNPNGPNGPALNPSVPQGPAFNPNVPQGPAFNPNVLQGPAFNPSVPHGPTFNPNGPYGPAFNPSGPYGPAPTTQPVPSYGQPTSFTPDAWIFSINNPNAQQPTSRPNIRPPRTELQKFDGNARNWPMFIQSFKIFVHDTVDCDAVRLTHLRSCLGPDIQRHLGEALVNPGLYQFALMELQRKFGNPQIVAKACTAALLELQPFRDGDHKALESFASTIHSVVATLSQCGYGMELYSTTTLLQIVAKLPPILKGRWGEVSWSMQPQLPSLTDFDWWLDNVSMAEYSVNASVLSSRDQQKPSRTSSASSSSRSRNQQSGPAVYHANATSCSNCTGNHAIDSCYKFKALTVEGRAEVIKLKKLCFRCLANDHIGADCPRSETCNNNGCKGLHHPLIHGAPRLFPPKTTPRVEFSPKVDYKSPPPSPSTARSPSTSGDEATQFSGATSNSAVHRGTLLPIVPVVIKANGTTVKTYALLDNGSEITMVTKRLAEQTHLQGPIESTTIGTVNGAAPPQPTMRVAFQVAATEGDAIFDIEDAFVISSLSLSKRAINLKGLVRDYPHLATVPLGPSTSEEVGMLIGLDNPALHEIFDQRADPFNHRAPRAILTCFGWCIIGPVSSYSKVRESTFNNFAVTIGESQSSDERLDSMVKQFLHADLFGVKPDAKPPVGPAERRALDILAKTVRHVGDRYEAGLLWKFDEPRLPNNRKLALRRLTALERRLIDDPSLAAAYSKVMNDYIDSKHGRKLTPAEASIEPIGRTWYVAHHAVFNPNKPGKCRVVFDGSLKFMGYSLNSELLKGPDFLPNLPGVLLRFRRHAIAIVADIEKMFLQVRVRAEDGPAFRYLWRTPGSREPPDTYQMDVQIFGAVSSPSICSYVLRQAAKDCGTHSDLVFKEVCDHFYVDNWLVSYSSEGEAISNAKVMYDSLLKGGFKLTQWAASSPSVRSSLPDRAQANSNLNLDLDSVPVERTLGLQWDYSEDTFVLKVIISDVNGKTKRAILRTVSSIFDPLGFLAAVTFTAKSLLQDIWRTGVGWDDEIDPQLLVRWHAWRDALSSLESLTIPRCYFTDQDYGTTTQLHIFADASELGFGAVGYLRREYSDRVDTSFVMAKSRVAALKFVTIPRMELCAAVMAVRLGIFIREEIKFPLERTTYWSDSTTVLSWINSTSFRFHTYVGNRLGEILESSQPEDWYYVPGASNPADELSRGLDAAVLTADHRWFAGPSFLRSSPDKWPVIPFLLPPDPLDPEVRASNWIGFIQRPQDKIDLLINKTSRWDRLVRMVAYILRWSRNPRRARGNRSGGELTASEVTSGRLFLIRRTQLDAYPDEIHDLKKRGYVSKGSHLLQFTPFLNSDAIMCVGGRVDEADLPFDTRHPIILPARARLTDILIWKAHLDCAHSSNEKTLHELRRQYWVPKGLTTIRRIVRACVICKRYNPKPLQPQMASLPFFRLQPGLPAFSRTGVDYFGPIEVTIFRRKVKRWGCLFTCLSSRAVCLVKAYSLNTDSFISCLTRFESRFGTPLSYHSDNGTNFVGAKNEFEECFKKMDQAKISNHLTRREVEWHFNPPSAPHFGGVWERLVRSAKRAIIYVTRGKSITDEVLSTALAYAENMLNNRPLGNVSSDPRSPDPLTPNHLLLARANPNLPPDVFDQKEISSKKKWRATEALMDQFWKRWQTEWVPSLIKRQKWAETQRNLRVGDIVMLISPESPRGTWPIARVFKVNPSPDGVVRSVWIWTNKTELHRPVVDLCLLETEEDEEVEIPLDDALVCPDETRAGDVADISSL